MNRIDKIRILEKIFSEKDISILKDANKKYSIVLEIKQDNGLKRQATALYGNELTIWNYTDKEIEKVRVELKNKYEIVWVCEYDTI